MLINADDLGMSATVNAGVLECFRQGWISSASIMANMPAFAEACALIHTDRLCRHIGIHITLTEGRPLTDRIQASRVFCDNDGRFVHRRHWHLSNLDRQALATEINAQIDRCRAFGLTLPHADSHQHVHIDPAILPVVIGVLKQRGIRRLRVARNIERVSAGGVSGLYRRCVNGLIAWRGMRRTARFGSLADFQPGSAALNPDQQPWISGCTSDSSEIMVHPCLSPAGVVIDHVDGDRLDDRLQAMRSSAGVLCQPDPSGPAATRVA